MSIKIEAVDGETGGSRILKGEGDVDMDSSPALRDQIKTELLTATLLKVDLSKVGYLDSSGVAVRIAGYKGAQKSTVDHRLLNPSGHVKMTDVSN